MNNDKEAYQYLLAKNYSKAIDQYEQAVEAEPEVKSHYWFLGLALLLQGQEAEAQMTWLMAMADGEIGEIEEWTDELVHILDEEANRQYTTGNTELSWVIRNHIREISPTYGNNLLRLIALSLQLEKFEPEDLVALGVLEALRSSAVMVDKALVLHLLETLLHKVAPHPRIIEFAEVSRSHIAPETYVEVVLTGALKIAHFSKKPDAAAYLAEFCLQAQPSSLEVLFELSPFYQNARQYEKGIEVARQCLATADALPDKIFASYLLLRALMNAGGYWAEAMSVLEQHESLLKELLEKPSIPLDLVRNARLNVVSFFFAYFRDQPQQNRQLQEQVFEICRANMQLHNREFVEKYQQRNDSARSEKSNKKRLKIGYISHCFYEHSVGWLARWLLQHHDHDQFELYLYMLNYREIYNDSLQPYFRHIADHARLLGADRIEVAETIYNDEIDILVDLDSVTLDATCNVLSLKPAPIQVTWLGWDAIGLSTVDYFIADPYVLPENAQDYYTEKIWRLPQTYIAVDGFEVGVPTLRRDQLDIPDDAVVYFSGQRGYKRHRDTARLQMQILSQVPNSYFLIKGMAKEESIQAFFYELAAEVGVEKNRLRFLPEVHAESIHRANLGIADIVLDTYPYNGATTTLETLWMGIPLVTRVGQQFAARNSYTMMVNAGIEEGIAWTDEEYVEWGVRLGLDAALRQNVHWKLLRSRQTSPLWNGKQFAQEMEKAYQQMWQYRISQAE